MLLISARSNFPSSRLFMTFQNDLALDHSIEVLKELEKKEGKDNQILRIST